jgi:hypothetical protein
MPIHIIAEIFNQSSAFDFCVSQEKNRATSFIIPETLPFWNHATANVLQMAELE